MDAREADNLLFDYFRDILFSPEKAPPDLTGLPEEFWRWGEALKFLSQCVLENKTFVTALSKGNLSIKAPPVDNPIAAPAKALQGSLRHITWQTNQIAKGDYKQRLDFMGEFTDGFNTMVCQLAERTNRLEQAKISAEEKNVELNQTRELFLVLMYNTPEFMIVLDVEDNTEYVCNTSAEAFKNSAPEVVQAARMALWNHAKAHHSEYCRWDMILSVPDSQAPEGRKKKYYDVDSYPMIWKGRNCLAHIVCDRTVETEKEQQLLREALDDPLTGLFNRRYAMERLKQLYDKNSEFCISMVDVDHLKYCNDVHGHERGDEYLRRIGQTLLQLGATVCRIGGDEFLVIAENTSIERLNASLESLRGSLMHDKLFAPFPFVQSFSYGTCANAPMGGKIPSDLLKEADAAMYAYKAKNKPEMKELKAGRV